MRSPLTLASILALAGCGSAQDIAADACDGFIKSSLKAPSTYKRVNVVIDDSPISKQAYAVAAGSNPDDPLYKFHLGQATNPANRSVIVEYDAQNSFGVPLRSKQLCEFLMRDTTTDLYSGDPKQTAENIANMNKARALSAALNSEPADQQPCCLKTANGDVRKGG